MKESQRRIQSGRKRQVKHVMRRLEKLMKTVAYTLTAIQLVFSDSFWFLELVPFDLDAFMSCAFHTEKMFLTLVISLKQE
ncbi:hypothetical protein HanRHA438_Chr07g0321101 [Helianthus annuus]|nr:hypothetical protein HanRHA438_Chr07g0321101 [Helianthus annuus]